MSWVAAAVVGGAVIGGVASNAAADKQASAAQSAADTSAGASMYAADIQKQIYDQTREDQTPWRDAGKNALAQMVSGTTGENPAYTRAFSMADYQADPGYAFRLSEGMKALERSAAARGGLLSGAAMKGINRYGQDYASNEYQNAYNRFQSNQTNQFNRLASIAGVGQTANNALGVAGQNYANRVGNIAMTNGANIGDAQLAAGAARASSYQGIGNALGNAIGRINWGGLGGGANTGAGSYYNPANEGVGGLSAEYIQGGF